MKTEKTIREGTFGKIIVPENEYHSFESNDIQWYSRSSISLCLTSLSILRKKFEHVNILDIGYDPGYFTIPFARFTKDIVYSQRLERESQDMLTRSLELNKITNVAFLNSAGLQYESPFFTLSDKIQGLIECDIEITFTKEPEFQDIRFIHIEYSKLAVEKLLLYSSLIQKFRAVVFITIDSEEDKIKISKLCNIFKGSYFLVSFSFGYIFIPSEHFWNFYYFIRNGVIFTPKLVSKINDQEKFNYFFKKYHSAIQKFYRTRWKLRLYTPEE